MAKLAAAAKGFKPASTRVDLALHLGNAGIPLGKLIYQKDGAREFSQFAYDAAWRASADFFTVSPDVLNAPGFQQFKPAGKEESCFFKALADTEPDDWGRRVIARAHAKAREKDTSLPALTTLDFLCHVEDFSRMGALRLHDTKTYLRTSAQGRRQTPPLLELGRMLTASRAVEENQETQEDLRYLQGKGTSLGGMRPKCTVLDEDGFLAMSKFPSVKDERSITRGEVLALQLAKLAGIDVARARVQMVGAIPVAIIRRFDRTAEDGRIPYMSGTTLLQAKRGEERAYTEVIDELRGISQDFQKDARELWRRLVFNHLITNVDDHLHNIGLLYVGRKQWTLSPAFDLNPFPDKDRESKTWLSEDTGPITSVDQLMGQAARFELATTQDALKVLGEVVKAVQQWRTLATSSAIGLTQQELGAFAPAFEHEALVEALQLLA
ncbi:HipA domain-containing protein [Variovorax sp. J22R133]|uniref:type II toxin-antitoxin system HipA family toxin n=1 Tax=Variovorax brevis TaxID=3053503 RepID=UPI0025781340|nr:HipA domain-containing protein [Variovorax sp. J22R133]MDM0117996.1 HipA domain-containing protein [Variovorax sp. J22R133]